MPVRFLAEWSLAAGLAQSAIALALFLGGNHVAPALPSRALARAIIMTASWWFVLRRYFTWANRWAIFSVVGLYMGILGTEILIADIYTSAYTGLMRPPFINPPPIEAWDRWAPVVLFANGLLGIIWGLLEWASIRCTLAVPVWWVALRILAMVGGAWVGLHLPQGQGDVFHVGLAAGVAGLVVGLFTGLAWLLVLRTTS